MPTFRARFLAAVPATESSLLLSRSKNTKSRNNLPDQKDDNDTSPEVFFKFFPKSLEWRLRTAKEPSWLPTSRFACL